MSESSDVTFDNQKETDDELGPEDSVSQASYGSCSHASSSSDRVKAAAVAAGLAVIVKRLPELHALEVEELVIEQRKRSALEIEELVTKHRKQTLEVDVQLAKAIAERDFYDQVEATVAASRPATLKSSVVMTIDHITAADMTEPARVIEDNAFDLNFMLECDADGGKVFDTKEGLTTESKEAGSDATSVGKEHRDDGEDGEDETTKESMALSDDAQPVYDYAAYYYSQQARSGGVAVDAVNGDVEPPDDAKSAQKIAFEPNGDHEFKDLVTKCGLDMYDPRTRKPKLKLYKEKTQVKTRSTTLVRPVTKLCLLEAAQ